MPFASSKLSIFFVVLLIINSFLIKDGNHISLYAQTKLIDTQELIDQYDKEIYQLNNSTTQELLYQDRVLQRNINAKIEKRNELVDKFRLQYEEYFNFEKTKNKLSFLDLLKWQPKFNLYFIFIIMLIVLYGLYRFNEFDSNNFDGNNDNAKDMFIHKVDIFKI